MPAPGGSIGKASSESITTFNKIGSEEALPMLPPGAGINEMIGEYKLEKDVI